MIAETHKTSALAIRFENHTMDDALLDRYSRHILLPEIDITGQRKLASAHALIIGLGGLGSPVAMYLASSGLGHLTLCDPDKVELSNLQRQIIHGTSDIGRVKSISAADRLSELNSNCHVNAIDHALHGEELINIVGQANIVIDATDNFETRFLLNQVCVDTHTPLVSGAVTRFEGQLSLFHANHDQPCYRCLYPDDTSMKEGNCSERGVLAPFAGVIGSLMACETIKWITGAGECLTGKLLTINAKSMRWRQLQLNKDPYCPVCSQITTNYNTA